MHLKLHDVYGSFNVSNNIELSLGTDILKKLKAAFTKAIKYIHNKGSFTADDLKHKNVKPLITLTNDVFKNAIDAGIKTEIPDALAEKFNRDIFVFSGLKTYAQLKDASLLLFENGKIKSYQKFEQDVLKINNAYNKNYLQTEYNYAVNSALSASQYIEYAKDGDAYNLQIRTAEDDKVRASHAAMDNITLPFSSEFWNTHWTPFDWGCRCRIIQVLKSKYQVTDLATAIELGNKAVPKMFRYNPAKQGAIFPPKHPYYPQYCNGAKLNVTGILSLTKWLLDAEDERCKAKKVVEEMAAKVTTPEERKAKDKEIREWAKQNIPESGRHISSDKLLTGKLTISRGSIKSIASHFTDPALKEVAKEIINLVDSCKHIGSADVNVTMPNADAKQAAGVTKFHYYKFEWNGYNMRLNTEEINGEFEKPYAVNIIIKK